MDMHDPYDSVYTTLFGVRRSVRYHQRRRSYFETINTTSVWLQVISGSSAVVAVAASLPGGAMALAGLAATLAALNLVVGTQRKATTHAGLALRFAQLERDMVPHEESESATEADAVAFKQRRVEIEQDEPPKRRAIDLLCHNELVQSTYRHESTYPVGRWKRWIGHIADVDVAEVLKRPEPPPESLPI